LPGASPILESPGSSTPGQETHHGSPPESLIERPSPSPIQSDLPDLKGASSPSHENAKRPQSGQDSGSSSKNSMLIIIGWNFGLMCIFAIIVVVLCLYERRKEEQAAEDAQVGGSDISVLVPSAKSHPVNYIIHSHKTWNI
jgi:hypothetical protein